MKSYTKVGEWLERHGWVLERTQPHGYAETHYWRNPQGELHTQTYALIAQRSRNRALKDLAGASTTPDQTERK